MSAPLFSRGHGCAAGFVEAWLGHPQVRMGSYAAARPFSVAGVMPFKSICLGGGGKMKGMKPSLRWRIFNGLTELLVLLCAATLVASYIFSRGIPLSVPPLGMTRWELCSGILVIERTASSPVSASTPQIDAWVFHFGTWGVGLGSPVVYWGQLNLDKLMLVVTVFALVSFALQYRRPTGLDGRTLCRICGYDLRATPDRCPECGTLSNKMPGSR